VSQADAESMRSLYGISRIAAVPTGVDLEYFAPPAQSPAVADLVFVGAMDWLPNIDGIKWFVDQILPRRRRRGRYLSAARADAGLGYRGGSRHPQSGRRRRNRAGSLAAALCDVRSFDPGFYCVGSTDYGMSPFSTAGHFLSAGPMTRSGPATNLSRRSSS